jgi:hypothetical protein
MISGVTCPSEPNCLYVQNFGPDFDKGIISKEPPEEDRNKEYTVLVPWVDDDGNDLAGIRTPHLEVPLATFTGWNFRRKGKILSGLVGSYLPFTKTAEERGISGDPRLSVEERYRSKAHYIRSITFAVQRLVNQRLLLEEDADRYVELAINNTDLWALRSIHLEPFQPR